MSSDFAAASFKYDVLKDSAGHAGVMPAGHTLSIQGMVRAGPIHDSVALQMAAKVRSLWPAASIICMSQLRCPCFSCVTSNQPAATMARCHICTAAWSRHGQHVGRIYHSCAQRLLPNHTVTPGDPWDRPDLLCLNCAQHHATPPHQARHPLASYNPSAQHHTTSHHSRRDGHPDSLVCQTTVPPCYMSSDKHDTHDCFCSTPNTAGWQTTTSEDVQPSAVRVCLGAHSNCSRI